MQDKKNLSEPREVIAKVWSNGHVLTGTEIVRCKDCKNYSEFYGRCEIVKILPRMCQPGPEDFCSKSEKR